ncbi:ABC transporter permease [Sedimentibacter hydroxybenzoicus DSM 7310]|uniref:ABC transporter permease n=1 Tax=Sedimentibacter hydroxybenzoicus DSM 7310 TaxID=1123245 RepID=A0A974BMH2_SEDHY|nr:DUF6290 family protein [Sedimentibacter hydroxybenzoicus]NYB75566.1 ABC transporter permease [Sedimentibacter hydroxybenzoicus DSM 7310]
MKNTLWALLIIVLIASLMLIYVESNTYGGMAEFCLNEPVSAEKIKDALEQGKVYDYLIVYDLYNRESSKVYKGNMNLLLAGRIKENTDIGFSEREVLMGDDFAERNYAYNPIGQNHEFNNAGYTVTAIVNDSHDVYYSDLNLLENQNIKRQRIYAVLKDKDGIKIEENTLLSILKSKGIVSDAHIYYDNLSKLLLKLIILCFISFFICAIYNIIKRLRKLLRSIFSEYKNNKYDVGVWEYINRSENLGLIRGILLYLSALLTSIICIAVLLIRYLNLRMPYRFNPVSPKSIYGMIKSFFDLVSYYLHNGITEMSVIAFKIVLSMVMALIFYVVVIILKRLEYRYDLKVVKEYENEKKNSKVKHYSLNEVKKELGIDA